MPFGFFFDPTYVLLIPALIFALWAQWKVQKTYAKYSKVRAANGRTGAMPLPIARHWGRPKLPASRVGAG